MLNRQRDDFGKRVLGLHGRSKGFSLLHWQKIPENDQSAHKRYTII